MEAFKQQVSQVFPGYLRADAEAISVLLYHHKAELHQLQQLVMLNGDKLLIPCRLYVDGVGGLFSSSLTSAQQVMMRCLMLRHHSGFVRQQQLERLLSYSSYYIVPYTLHLLGEYVVEVVEVLKPHIQANSLQYVRFIEENPLYWQQVQSRLASYWDAYYKTRYSKLSSYPAKLLVDRIEKAKTLVS